MVGDAAPPGFSHLPPLREVIARHGLMARKALGQNFLLDGNLTDKIVRHAGGVAGCNVLEIGPGPGGLTRSLLSAGAAQLVAVEKDARAVAALQELVAVSGGRLRVIEGDALEADPLALIAPPRRIIANLPYNIATPLLLRWLRQIYEAGPSAFVGLTLMFQKEVAQRITAAPGSKAYGRLSVMSQWLCDAQPAFDIPPEAFTPPPKVTSSVVVLTPRAAPLYSVEWRALERVMAAAFGQRRKMLRAALKTLGPGGLEALEAAGIDPTARAESLDVTTLCRLAAAYANITPA